MRRLARAAGTAGPAGALLAAAALAGVVRPAALAAQDYVYVVSQEEVRVTVLDADGGTPVTSVDLTALGFSPGAKAHHVAVEPDGSFWYVSLIADGKVLKFDRSNRLVGSADFETPGMLALDPASDWLYVGRSMAAVNPPQRIGLIRRSTMELEEIDVFFPRPHALAVDPVHHRVYSASLGENRMAWAPVGSEAVELEPVPGPLQTLVQFAVSPDGRWLVAGGQMTGDLLVWDVSGERPALAHTVHVGGQPWHPVFTPDGAELWVPDQTGGAVNVVETSGWTVAATVRHEALAEPHGSAVSPDGRWVFVSGRNTSGSWDVPGRPGTVAVIDRATRKVRRVVEVGRYAAGMGTAARLPR